MTLKIKEAISIARENGKQINGIIIARQLWDNKNEGTLNTNMSNLINGNTKRINIEWIQIICELTGVDANFLLGINEKDL